MERTTVSLAQAAQAIAAIGQTNTILLRGEPGVGKSSILKTLAQSHPKHTVSYIDVATLDLGDIAMPVVDKKEMQTHYAPNSRFNLSPTARTPVIIMLDELGKAPKPILNMLLPLMLERRLGDIPLPEGSIVFATTNLDTDGVGDNIPAHAYNRLTELIIRKPTQEEWVNWAMDNGVNAEVLAFAAREPQLFQSYVDLDVNDKNPYIFNPLKGVTRGFVSPRSLEKAGHIVKQRKLLGVDTTIALLTGTIGKPAALQMQALIDLADKLPDVADIVKEPTKASLPESAGAQFVLAYQLSAALTQGNCDAIMTYMHRLESVAFEAVCASLVSMCSQASKVKFMVQNQLAKDMLTKAGKFV